MVEAWNPDTPVAFTPPPGTTTPVLDAQGRIDEDVHCRSCGYNLRGLDLDSRCPECGASVGMSVYGDFLRYSDPDWVGRLSKGMDLIVYAIALAIFGGLATLLVVLASEAMWGGALEPVVAWVVVLYMVVAVLMLRGIWLLTTLDPAKPLEETDVVRNVARYGLLVNWALSILAMVLSLASVVIAIGLQIIANVASLAGFIAIFIYVRRLALRLPDEGLAKQTRIVMWGLVVGTVINLLGTLIEVSTASSTTPGGSNGVSAIGGLTIFVFAIWSLLLIDKYRKRFREAATQARDTWAARPAARIAMA